MGENKPLVRVILGPTAVGKTDFAIAEAKKVGGAVISADSRQIYGGMNIGTAKPRQAWRDDAHAILEPDIIDGVPHYLLNVASASEPWTLAHWQEAVQKVMADLVAKDVPVFVVGGTMLYIDSLLFHYDIPAVAPQFTLRAELEKEPAEVLYKKLLAADPAAGHFIEPHHKQRIIRALEVIEVSGKPFSQSRIKREPPYRFEVRGLFPAAVNSDEGWKLLKERVAKRVTAMVDGGLLDETKTLQERFSPALPLLCTMNYLQAAKTVAGEISRAEARQEMTSANMKYARRQMSWWRGRSEIFWQKISDQ